ncbi:MAG: ATP-binding protein [Desulfococcaceae bacterium]
MALTRKPDSPEGRAAREARIRALVAEPGLADSPERLGKLAEEVGRLRDDAGGPPDTCRRVLEGFLRDQFPDHIPEGPCSDILAELSAYLNEVRQFGLALSRGDLSAELRAGGALAGGLKSLQASLRHLAWQTRSIADGNLDIRVDFMGDFSTAFNTMARRLRETREALKRRNAELEQARAAAEAASRAKSDFLANVTHEIRTPMNIILGFTEVLAAEVGQPRHREFLRAMDASGRLLLTLINDILDLSRVEMGKLILTPAPTDMRQVAREIVQLFEGRAAEKKIRIAAEAAASVPDAVVLDPIRMRQVLVNLVGNAVKFTRQGEVRIGMAGRAVDGDRLDLTVTVQDTGPGIPPAERERIFEPFVQRREMSGEPTGTGLGLAIARRLVRLMNGSVRVTEAPGGGALFTLVFRDVPLAKKRAEARESEDGLLAESPRFAGGLVLVGDDVELNRRLLRAMLSVQGLAVIEADGGTAVLEETRARKPDLVLLDLRMPDRDGVSVARELRASPETADIPLVAVTATIRAEEHAAAEEVFDAVLIKPVRRRQLSEVVARFLSPAETFPPDAAPEPNPNPDPPAPPLLSSASVDRLVRLAELLEQDFLPEWRRLTEVMVVGDVEDFARRIRDLGRTYRCEPVRVWGEHLARRADSVDIAAIRQSLDRFPEVIDALRELLGGT